MSVGGLRGLVSQACFNCHALSLLADMRTRGGMLWEGGRLGREGVGDLYMRGRRVESEERRVTPVDYRSDNTYTGVRHWVAAGAGSGCSSSCLMRDIRATSGIRLNNADLSAPESCRLLHPFVHLSLLEAQNTIKWSWHYASVQTLNAQTDRSGKGKGRPLTVFRSFGFWGVRWPCFFRKGGWGISIFFLWKWSSLPLPQDRWIRWEEKTERKWETEAANWNGQHVHMGLAVVQWLIHLLVTIAAKG